MAVAISVMRRNVAPWIHSDRVGRGRVARLHPAHHHLARRAAPKAFGHQVDADRDVAQRIRVRQSGDRDADLLRRGPRRGRHRTHRRRSGQRIETGRQRAVGGVSQPVPPTGHRFSRQGKPQRSAGKSCASTKLMTTSGSGRSRPRNKRWPTATPRSPADGSRRSSPSWAGRRARRGRPPPGGCNSVTPRGARSTARPAGGSPAWGSDSRYNRTARSRSSAGYFLFAATKTVCKIKPGSEVSGKRGTTRGRCGQPGRRLASRSLARWPS